jgi:hypothetical protein
MPEGNDEHRMKIVDQNKLQNIQAPSREQNQSCLMPTRLLMRYWIEIYGIRNLTKEINIRINWQAYPKENTKWRTIKAQHAGHNISKMQAHDGFKPSPQNLV